MKSPQQEQALNSVAQLTYHNDVNGRHAHPCISQPFSLFPQPIQLWGHGIFTRRSQYL